MAMFSKALSSLTSNISSAYSLSQQPTSLAGPWKIYDAKHRKTGKPASVFVFSPKVLDQQQHGSLGGRSSGGVSLKKAQEEVVDRLKREAGALARLRHPSILELAEPVEETRNGGLMFATEPVTASLAQVLQDKDGSERGGGRGGSRFYVEEADGTRRRKELEVDELEIQKGLLQLGKGLEFLHESAGLVHANLTPESILINAKGDWKIAGLAFCGPHESSTSATSMPPISLHEVLSHDPRLPRNVQLDIDYTSPDFVLDNHLTSSADMFSLGLLIIALYNTPHASPLKTSGSLSTYKRTFSSSSTIPTQHNNFHVPTNNTNPFPPKLATDLLPRLITRRPAQRLTAREFQEAAYFDNILVSTIRFLDALPAKTPQEKAAFMRGLPRIMPQFPKSVLEKKVLPALLEEMKDRELLAPILTCVFAMVQAMPTGKRAFESVVAPKLREVFLSSSTGQGGKHAPSQHQQAAGAAAAGEKDTSKEAGLMVLLENMSTVATHCDGRTFREDIFPILLLALDALTTHGLVDAALGTLPVVLPVLDFSTIKNELFPVIAGVFAKTSSLAIKIRGLEAFYTLCGGSGNDGVGGDDDQAEDDLNGVGVPDMRKGGRGGSSSSIILDKFTVQEKVVPLLKGIKTKEPGVMMAALKVFRQVGEVADSEFLAVEVLPALWQMSLGPLLNLQQFQAFMRLVKRLSERIEREQTRKLQEMGGGNGGVGVGGVGARRAQQVGSGGASNGLSNGEDADFETLVSGRKPAAAGNDDLMNDWGVPSTTPAQPLGTQTYTAKKTHDQPTFSWQTPSSPAPSSAPAPQQPAMNALRSGAQPAARTITPDQSLSSFASLTPQSAFSQPLQPTRTGSQTGTSMGSMPLRPAQQPPQQSSGFNSNGTSLDWSAAATKNANWTVPKPPQQQQQMSGQGTNGFGATSKPSGAGFGIPPPPVSPQNVGQFGQLGAGQRQGSWGVGQQQQQMNGSSSGGPGGGGGGGGGGGTGLDRYESLI
ncbi:kinase-like protein [Hortaea werneckii]|nr:kinase-like protein [Hortaea werneckii]KAI6836243.1 kinase-like protein [Hortaea werneckii]KAI6898065.1 kinase-like protein [Hortaea werneckii]KAI6918916.1 kinase-like protein [Hortaea werneckii]KAI6958389.1 kinase-like protein [Hortaea werneckii]